MVTWCGAGRRGGYGRGVGITSKWSVSTRARVDDESAAMKTRLSAQMGDATPGAVRRSDPAIGTAALSAPVAGALYPGRPPVCGVPVGGLSPGVLHAVALRRRFGE